MESFFSNTGLWLAYILVIIGFIAAIAFFVITLVNDFMGQLKSIIGVVVVLILFAIGYMAAAEPSAMEMQKFISKYQVNMSEVKFVSGMITTGTTMLIITAIAGLASQIYTMIKG